MLFHNHPRHDRLRIAIDVLSMLAAALIVLLCISLWSPWSVAYALDSRAPWTSNHVTGTPDPPPPFEIQRVYPKLTFKNPLEIAFEPGGNRVFIAEQGGKIFSFPNV